MLRIIMRVLAALFLIGSLGLGGFFTYILFTPSDEEMMYEQKHKEAVEKIKKAGAAQGTPYAETLLQDAKEASEIANLWREGYRDRLRQNRMAVIANAAVALISLIVLLLTFVKRKTRSQPPSSA